MSKVRKLIASLLIVSSVITVHTVEANASTGWMQDGHGWWYSEGNSLYKTGWVQLGGQWYFFGEDGYMKTGWVQDGGNWYYMKSDGSMARDIYVTGYYLGSNGAWTTDTSSSTDISRYKRGEGGKAGNDPENAQRMAEQNGYQDNTQSTPQATQPSSSGSSSDSGGLSSRNKSDGLQVGHDTENAQKMSNQNQ